MDDWAFVCVIVAFCALIAITCFEPDSEDKFIKCIDSAHVDKAVEACDKYFDKNK